MRLYHFTHAVWLAPIREQGLQRRYVPQLTDGGVWLTDDRRWYKQAWASGLAYRLTVELADDDPKLEAWSALARRLAVPQSEYDALHTTGGRQSHRWWVYLGNVPADSIVEVEPRPGGVTSEEHDATGMSLACLLCIEDADNVSDEALFATEAEYQQHYDATHKDDPRMSLTAARGVFQRKDASVP